MTVHVEKTDDLAFVTIDNPPVNAAGQAVRAGLIGAIADTDADDTVKAVILRAKGATFTAGADVSEFDKPAAPPHLPDVILALETTTKPWIAALHGSILGGGLEIALGCNYRIADARSKLGLPEVTLGLIPGAGGTVRLPRLIDPIAALTMISSGKPVTAAKALSLRLIDAVAGGDMSKDAIALARTAIAQPLPAPLSQRPAVAVNDADALNAAKDSLRKKARGATAPKAAIDAVQRALDLPADQALKAERETFMRLKSSRECAALRRVFFAERSAAKLPMVKGLDPAPLNTIGVIGGGTMGAGIAAACLLRGLPVTLIERDDKARATGYDRVAGVLKNSLDRGLMDQAKHDFTLAMFKSSTDYADLSNADLVIEAVFEDMDVKHGVLAALDRVLRKDAIIASNTSYLDINVMAAQTAHPSRVIGLHFFSPAYIMKLVEVIITDHASPTALATGFALAKRLGKIAVPAGVCDGFIGNRIMTAYRRKGEIMVEDGAWPWDIDAAMRDFGFPMGLFEMQDLAGLDISWAMRKRQAATRDPATRYVNLGDKLCEAGRLGKKTGAGWYDYNEGRAVKSELVETLILDESKRKGITRKKFPQDVLIGTILTTMQTEANALFAEGIAQRSEDIDVVMVNGYGFPRWRGGPMFMGNDHSKR